MALALENYVEEKTWKEWSDLLDCFQEWRVRTTYYPHNMDLFDAKINEIQKQRRKCIQTVINERDNICLEYRLLNESEKSLIQECSTKIKTGYTVYDFVFECDKLKLIMQKIVNLQNQRLEKLREMTRGRDRTEYIVPPSPVKKTLLNKKKEQEKEVAKKKKQEKSVQEKSQPVKRKREKRVQDKSQPLRRSKRLIEKKYGTDFAYKYLVNYV